MYIRYIMPDTMKKVHEELGVELGELAEHVSKRDVQIIEDLKNKFSLIVNKPIKVNGKLDLSKLSKGPYGITYDGYDVVVPAEDLNRYEEMPIEIVYGILKAYIEYHNEHSDIDAINTIVMDNYITLHKTLVG